MTEVPPTAPDLREEHIHGTEVAVEQSPLARSSWAWRNPDACWNLARSDKECSRDEYERYWLQNGFELLKQRGAMNVHMLRDDGPHQTEFVTKKMAYMRLSQVSTSS
jgi:hypothetical protein